MPEARAARPEPRTEGQRDGARAGIDTVWNLGPARPHHAVAPAQPFDADREVVRWIQRMCIHPRDDAPTGGTQSDVQSRGGLPGRVVENTNPRFGAGEFLEDGARPIRRAAVGEDELELALEPLAPHRRNGVLDVALLVEHRCQHAHVDGHAGPPVRNAARAPASASVVCACAITVPASTNLVRSPSSSPSLRSASATAWASPGWDEKRRVACQRGDSPHVGGHRGQSRGERLDEHLGHALRPRDVQKGVRAVVGIAKPGIDSDVSAQSDHVLQTELRDPAGELGARAGLPRTRRAARPVAGPRPRPGAPSPRRA